MLMFLVGMLARLLPLTLQPGCCQQPYMPLLLISSMQSKMITQQQPIPCTTATSTSGRNCPTAQSHCLSVSPWEVVMGP